MRNEFIGDIGNSLTLKNWLMLIQILFKFSLNVLLGHICFILNIILFIKYLGNHIPSYHWLVSSGK